MLLNIIYIIGDVRVFCSIELPNVEASPDATKSVGMATASGAHDTTAGEYLPAGRQGITTTGYIINLFVRFFRFARNAIYIHLLAIQTIVHSDLPVLVILHECPAPSLFLRRSQRCDRQCEQWRSDAR